MASINHPQSMRQIVIAGKERCRTHAAGAIEALAAEPWPWAARLDQAQITTAAGSSWVVPPGRVIYEMTSLADRRGGLRSFDTMQDSRVLNGSRHEVAKVNVILTRPGDVPEMNRIYASYFPSGNYPAHSNGKPFSNRWEIRILLCSATC